MTCSIATAGSASAACSRSQAKNSERLRKPSRAMRNSRNGNSENNARYASAEA
ncbi:hypothetical protein D3C77_621230 [compost metagenome]